MQQEVALACTAGTIAAAAAGDLWENIATPAWVPGPLSVALEVCHHRGVPLVSLDMEMGRVMVSFDHGGVLRLLLPPAVP